MKATPRNAISGSVERSGPDPGVRQHRGADCSTQQPRAEALGHFIMVVAPPVPVVHQNTAMFAGLVGMCGHMSTPVSRWVEISLVAEWRMGL